MIDTVVRYLLTGPDEQFMHPEWLRDKMPPHDQWTRAQADPRLAIIVSNSAAMARKDFWKRMTERHAKLAARYPRRLA